VSHLAYQRKLVNNKFKFEIAEKRQYANDGLIVLRGTVVGRRVKRGDAVALANSAESMPLEIIAALPGASSHELLLACAQAEPALKTIRLGDMLVATEVNPSAEAEQAEQELSAKEIATKKASSEKIHLKAMDVLRQHLEERKLARTKTVVTQWRT
jgi:hypothetical protein